MYVHLECHPTFMLTCLLIYRVQASCMMIILLLSLGAISATTTRRTTCTHSSKKVIYMSQSLNHMQAVPRGNYWHQLGQFPITICASRGCMQSSTYNQRPIIVKCIYGVSLQSHVCSAYSETSNKGHFLLRTKFCIKDKISCPKLYFQTSEKRKPLY